MGDGKGKTTAETKPEMMHCQMLISPYRDANREALESPQIRRRKQQPGMHSPEQCERFQGAWKNLPSPAAAVTFATSKLCTCRWRPQFPIWRELVQFHHSNRCPGKYFPPLSLAHTFP